MEIKFERNTSPKAKPQDESQLGFGKIFTDHMFIMEYDEGMGWHSPRIVPYGDISISPAAMVLHYGQEVFEGLKAYRTKDGRVLLFRPDKNYARLNSSNERLCIPQVDESFCIEALKELIKVDKDWIPHSEGTSLYIRPFIFAADPFLGVHPAHKLYYMVILSPSGLYYPEGLNPVKIYVESSYVRAVKGGMGYTKTGGNYAASLKAQNDAAAINYSQVLWLDGVERKYIEEVGAMNVFFVLDGEIVTPELDGATLPGVTRASCIELLRSWGYTVNERLISIDEVEEAHAAGKLIEMFGTGTAAVISPVGELRYKDNVMTINNNQIGEISQRLYDSLTSLQMGKTEDTFGWTVEVK
ncbi:MAG: branched-chain amino acid aminotransferase [Oscillospiraceae bacterium]|jgi:branched-chain amino acid aminotransferase|nr:branched-chain amino acid aminotransferase [Oscillospiraceae bacterium]